MTRPSTVTAQLCRFLTADGRQCPAWGLRNTQPLGETKGDQTHLALGTSPQCLTGGASGLIAFCLPRGSGYSASPMQGTGVHQQYHKATPRLQQEEAQSYLQLLSVNSKSFTQHF